MITRTVKLVPGETFTLPPAATVLAVSGSLVSTCGALPIPENLSCYGILYGVSDGGDTPSETNEEVTIKGFRINNTEHLFNSAFTHNAGATDITDEIRNRVNLDPYLSGILSEVCAIRYVNDSPKGGMFVISFKSLPSIMANAQVIMEQAGAPYSGSVATKVLVPIRSRAALTLDGLQPESCPCVN